MYLRSEHGIFLAFTRFRNGIYGLSRKGSFLFCIRYPIQIEQRDNPTDQEHLSDQAIHTVCLHHRGPCSDEILPERNLHIDLA